MGPIRNPIVPGYYADPEARIYQGRFWVYVTRSFTDYQKQRNLDAFSSSDMVTWEKSEGIIDMADFPWAWRAVWAPTIVEKDGYYYLMFATNDIQKDGEPGGLEIARSTSPGGPFRGYMGKPLIDRFVNRAQPIDAHLFKDDDGTVYLYYGGWGHCNVARMNQDMTGFLPFPDGEIFKEITPGGYVEGPCVLKKDGLYYFMWSLGSWGDGSYRIAYGTSDNALGPFPNKSTILASQEPIGTGPGHHGYLHVPETDEWFIVYHRRIVGNDDPGSRFLCIDRLEFRNGEILPVVMT